MSKSSLLEAQSCEPPKTMFSILQSCQGGIEEGQVRPETELRVKLWDSTYEKSLPFPELTPQIWNERLEKGKNQVLNLDRACKGNRPEQCQKLDLCLDQYEMILASFSGKAPSVRNFSNELWQKLLIEMDAENRATCGDEASGIKAKNDPSGIQKPPAPKGIITPFLGKVTDSKGKIDLKRHTGGGAEIFLPAAQSESAQGRLSQIFNSFLRPSVIANNVVRASNDVTEQGRIGFFGSLKQSVLEVFSGSNSGGGNKTFDEGQYVGQTRMETLAAQIGREDLIAWYSDYDKHRKSMIQSFNDIAGEGQKAVFLQFSENMSACQSLHEQLDQSIDHVEFICKNQTPLVKCWGTSNTAPSLPFSF